VCLSAVLPGIAESACWPKQPLHINMQPSVPVLIKPQLLISFSIHLRPVVSFKKKTKLKEELIKAKLSPL